MQDDLISRQAVIEQSIVLRDISNPDKEWEVVTVATIKHLKSVQPQQKVGRWIESHIPESTLCECSVCDFSCGAYSFNFCPMCGAKMEEGEDKE